MLKNRIYTYIILLFFYVPLLAQKPLVRSFNSFPNFNASQIYDITQDPNGFIWIASESGLFKFDGLLFRNIGRENGLANLKFTNLYLSDNGTLWTTQIDGKTWRIDDHILIQQKSSKAWPAATMIPLKSSFHMNNDTLSFISYGQDLYKFVNDSLFEHKKITTDQVIFQFIKPLLPKWQKKLGLFVQINRKKLFESSQFKYGRVSGFSNDSSFLFNVGNLQIFNYKNEIKYKFNSKIIHATIAVNKYHILSKQDVGLLLYRKNKLLDTLLKGVIVTDIFADKNNGIWIGTQHDGLMYIPSIDVIKYAPRSKNSPSQITDILNINNKIFVLEEHIIISQLDQKRKKLIQKLRLPYKAKKIIKTSNTSFLALGDYNIMIINIRNDQFNISKTLSFNAPIFNAVMQESYLRVASISGIISHYFSNNKENDTLLSDHHINNLCVWNNKLYAGNSKGLWEIDINNNIVQRSKNSISHISSDEKNLFVYYRNNNIEISTITSTKIINLRDPLSINHIFKSDNTLLISTKNGLKTLDSSLTNISEFEFINRTIRNNKIIKAYLIKNTLFLLNNNGLYSFPLETLSKYEPYPIQLQTDEISSIKKNKIELSVDKDLKHLHFIISTFNYENNIPSKLYYKINNDINIHTIQNNELNIAQISSGISNILISDNKNFNKNQNHLEINLQKTGYWYQNLYIQIILITLLIGLAILFIINRIRVLKRKNLLENTRIAKMQTVLQQQMNPHFIFNSLTSINHYVLQNKPMESSRYLTKFSSLIRKILDNSASHKVTLEEELEALEIYIDLELLRFKDKFSYSIKKSPNIDISQIKVVPFLIQPFIDTAIREHILNKSGKGTILIQFQTTDKYLVCNLIDNGVNKVLSEINSNIKSNNSTKSGTQIAEQRIEVYNKQNRNKILISHEIIKNHKNETSGNKTTIKYPLNQ